MNLFGRKSAGRAPVRPALARGFPWAFSEIPRSYEAQVRAGYLENAVAQRAVRMVAEAVGGAPLAISDPGLAALVAATSAGQSLLETLAAQLLLHGNGFIQILEGADGHPRELYALRPERVSIEGDARGWPVAFGYRANQVNTRLPADMVIHAKAMHPLDDHYGLGCLGAASGAIAIHNAATLWNKALLDNAARPSGALVYDAGEALSPDQFEQLRTELEASFSGAGNAGRPMLLEGGLKWQALSLTPAEMDFAGLKAAAAREIALAFGVPPVLLGLPGDATYANYREANRALWRQTVLPLAGKLLGAIAQGLARWYPGATLAVDLDRVTELSEDRERLWAQVNAAGFLTLNEKRAAVGLEALRVVAGDVPNAAPPVAETPVPSAPVPADAEVKYNHNHDPDNGQFAFAGGGGGFGGGGASGSWGYPAKPRIIARRPSAGRKPLLGNGGSFGGGGASEAIPIKPQPGPVRKDEKPPRKVTRPAPNSHTGSLLRVAVASPKRAADPPKMRRVTSHGYDFDIDEADRTRRAKGMLTLNPTQGRSRLAQLGAGGTNRLTGDHGGHYIAREFNGPTEKFNHFAQDAKFNKSEYRSLELHWRGLKQKGHKVEVDIVPHYEGSSQRPSSLTVTYYVDGKPRTQRFPNSSGAK